jgi:hypothetical protein
MAGRNLFFYLRGRVNVATSFSYVMKSPQVCCHFLDGQTSLKKHNKYRTTFDAKVDTENERQADYLA